MDMTGVYACLCDAVCDVTTVQSHLKQEQVKLAHFPTEVRIS